LIQRGGDFGRRTEDALLARSSKGRAVVVSLLDWLALLLVAGGAFTGLGLAGMAKIEPWRAAYEQGKATRAMEQREAGFRRGCLVIREASSRVDPKAVVAAVRLPLRPPGAPAGPPAGGEMLAARVAGPGLGAPVRGARSPSLLIGQQPGRVKPVQTAKSGHIPTLEPRG
jgi:hypothetical protein